MSLDIVFNTNTLSERLLTNPTNPMSKIGAICNNMDDLFVARQELEGELIEEITHPEKAQQKPKMNFLHRFAVISVLIGFMKIFFGEAIERQKDDMHFIKSLHSLASPAK